MRLACVGFRGVGHGGKEGTVVFFVRLLCNLAAGSCLTLLYTCILLIKVETPAWCSFTSLEHYVGLMYFGQLSFTIILHVHNLNIIG